MVTRRWFQSLSLGLALVLILAGVAFLGAPAAADEGAELWLSSAEPPAGLAVEHLSPPDQPVTAGSGPDEPPTIQSTVISQRLTGSGLRPRDAVVDFDVNSSGSCIYAVNNAFDVFNTPIWLPRGATVQVVRMYYNDASSSNSTAWFTVYDRYGNLVQEWPVSSSGSAGVGFNDTVEINHEIDYSTYSYMLNWRPAAAGSAMQLCGFRIFYEAPPFGLQFLPSIMREHDGS